MIGEHLFRRNLKNEIFEFKILKQAEKDRKLAEKMVVESRTADAVVKHDPITATVTDCKEKGVVKYAPLTRK